MSVKIRLSLTGKSHQISYRLIAQDTRSKRDGKFLEILGSLNPYQKTDAVKINKDRIKYYLSHGATFTPSAKYVFENSKLPPKPKKQKPKQETKKQEAQIADSKPEEIKTEVEATEENEPVEKQDLQENYQNQPDANSGEPKTKNTTEKLEEINK